MANDDDTQCADDQFPDDQLQTLATEFGIENGYWDTSGTWQQAPADVVKGILTARGIRGQTTPHQWQASFCLVVPASSQTLAVSEVLGVVDQSAREQLSSVQDWQCRVHLESGESVQTESQDNESGGVLRFASELPPGYHRLEFHQDAQNVIELRLIATPGQCFQASKDLDAFGVSAQVYSLCRSQEQGMGTFADLERFARKVVAAGGSFVGLNPLHALGDGQISPYAPSSRIAYNTLYIDRQSVMTTLFDEHYEESSQSGASLIDYQQEYALQNAFLAEVYQRFIDGQCVDQTQYKLFAEFESSLTAANKQYALYEVLQAHFSASNAECYGWMQWPEEYRHPQATAVQEFAEQAEPRCRFVHFCQWLAQTQLQRCVEVFAADPSNIGLYSDMALGVRANGADAWIFQDAYVFAASMGAPPDDFNPGGQDWGLPPLEPKSLAHWGYEPFLLALREAMRFAGAVRLDHVMNLFRLYWVLPEGRGGAYVRYPVEELFGLVALESQRNSCVVIGEDLGTVPDEIRDCMQRYGVLSYKVLIFMRGGDGRFLGSAEYPREALVTVSTHDLPTVSAYVAARDIAVRAELGLHEEGVLEQLSNERREALPRLEAMLGEENLLGEHFSKEEAIEWVKATSLFLSRTNCCIKVLQIEDLALQGQQVNLPGTTTEHPNWRRKLPESYEKVLDAPWVQEIFAAFK